MPDEKLFSPLEIQLVRSSLATKTDQEIADLVETSVANVRELINEITGGNSDERYRDVEKYQEECRQEKKKKKPVTVKVPTDKQQLVDKTKARLKERKDAENKWEKQRAINKGREHRRTYKTLEIDMTKMISVRMDKRTCVLVERQSTQQATDALIAQAKVQFELTKRKNPLFNKDQN